MNKPAISCEQAEMLVMGLLDNELSKEETKSVEQHLASCSSCASKYESFKNLKKDTSEMKFKNLPEVYWDEYWQHVYNRIERSIGWIFFSVGAIIISIITGYTILQEYFMNPEEPLGLKIGIGLLGIGIIVLFVSVLREKLMVRSVDKYRSILR